ncbi:MAG: nucleotidyltransferase domain-containing protein, partial [Nanoarchaeota archaeon]|nr:nucleotidyltransferase domain-containing protein [Nanoarchaeota archaeon]
MGKYTTSREADKKVEKDIQKIKNFIVKELNPISIILFGGFGRGEGTYEIVGKKIIPLNDYDMYVVTKNKIPDEKLEEIGKKCSVLIGKGGGEFVENYNEIYEKSKYFHVDLRWLDYNQLPKLRRINRTYELKYGSRVIYGEDVRKRIKEIKVPLSEAFRYLINPA